MKEQKAPCQTHSLTRGSCSLTPHWHGCSSRKLLAIAQLTAMVILLFAFSAITGFAQSTSTGTIVGTVTDQSGAVVPEASVAITNRATNTTTKTVSNSAGHYVFVNVDPGTFDLKITKQGFQTALVPNQVVEVGKALTEDVKLTIGAVTQEVTVETTGTELQTLNSTVGNDVTGVALESLPAVGRDVSTFAVLQPGVSPDGSVAGAVVDQSSFQLDGGQNSNDMDGSMQVYTPSYANDPSGGIVQNQIGAPPTGVMPTPIDSVEEFKVNTANQTADFNSSSGMQVQVVTKRGTNTVHGTVYEYYLDNNFSANSWDNNLSGTPLPSYHYSRFGAALGGPVIPKDILGGKTYLFGNFEGFRWPNSTTIERSVPTTTMDQGILTFGGTQYNLKALDPRGIGIDPTVQQMWTKLMPPPNDPSCGSLLGSRCDGVNTQGFKANVSTPQHSNFGVARLDHDFGPKWHFSTSYRYYNLSIATTNQIDIGGALPGDKLGVATAVAPRPQVPWYYVAGLTTNITSNTTNDFHYSYLRNYWAWQSKGDPPQLSGLGAAIEPLGEQTTTALTPYNVNTQATRTRFWDGQDNYLRDDLTMLHGNHLLSFGGIYQHNYDYHQRTDNGGGINYYPVYQLGDSAGSGLVDVSALGLPSGTTASRLAAAALGIVTDSQIAYTRSGPTLTLNPPLTPAFDQSTIPYYNVYFSDSWHMKPNFTLTYGLGWTLEMPPTEKNGKQIELVDSADQPIDVQAYIAARQRAALQGQVYNPEVGFALLGNTANSPKYPYLPFYGSFSPRVAAAWNPHFSGEGWMSKIFGEDKTVLRAGYGRIYGRLNGVDQVLVPLLGTGLIQAVQCRQVYMPNAVPGTPNGSCAPTGAPALTAANAFRIGVDGNTAPIAKAAATLAQPDYPGLFGNAEAGAGEALDPHFRPNDVDSFDFTIQRQLSNKVTMEVGYIGRWIHHEYQPININAVPYMMTMGGQQFQQAYANIEKALGCATSVAACGANIPAAKLSNGNANPAYAAYFNGLQQQPFFTTSLNSKYCNGTYPGTGGTAFANCTAAVASQEASNFTNQAVWSLWSDLDNGGTAAGFNFGNTMLNTAGQLSSGVGVNASIGHGNYNAGFVTLRMSDWKGLTLQQNLTYSKALGTGAFVQATSEYTVDDAFDINKGYGVQAFDRKYVYNLFLVYQPPAYKSQSGVVGHLLGGWSFAPILSAGSGAPMPCNTNTGGGFVSGTGAQGFGAGDGANFFDSEQCAFLSTAGTSASVHSGVAGGSGVGTAVAGATPGTELNIFSDPVAVWNNVRPPILGIDTRAGGEGAIRGLPYWNVDMSIRKQFKLTERFNSEFQFVCTNVFNHDVFYDPLLDITNPTSFGVLNAQGNNPRKMEFGLRVSW
jgi:hypothetical protein